MYYCLVVLDTSLRSYLAQGAEVDYSLVLCVTRPMIAVHNGTGWEPRPRVELSPEEKERLLAEWKAMGLNIIEEPWVPPACSGQRERFQDVSTHALEFRGIRHNTLPKDVRDLCECKECFKPCFSYCTACWGHFCCPLHWAMHMCDGGMPCFLGRIQPDGTVKEYIPCHFGPDAVLTVCRDRPDLPDDGRPWLIHDVEYYEG